MVDTRETKTLLDGMCNGFVVVCLCKKWRVNSDCHCLHHISFRFTRKWHFALHFSVLFVHTSRLRPQKIHFFLSRNYKTVSYVRSSWRELTWARLLIGKVKKRLYIEVTFLWDDQNNDPFHWCDATDHFESAIKAIFLEKSKQKTHPKCMFDIQSVGIHTAAQNMSISLFLKTWKKKIIWSGCVYFIFFFHSLFSLAQRDNFMI